MKSSVVNARVPLAKKEAANNVLEAIGSTPSELINSAYDYLLKFGKLPSTEEGENDRGQKQGFTDFLAQTSFAVDWRSADIPHDYKDYIRNGKIRDYESLA